MNAIYDLIGRKAYNSKMLHPVPRAEVVTREQYILERVKNRTILDIGTSGAMHDVIKRAAKMCYGVDINAPDEPGYYRLDIDAVDSLPDIPGVELVVAGEVIEHLDNAGHFLDLLKRYDCPVILTTPNAFSAAAARSMAGGVEQVNPEHVCWYSYQTFTTLAAKHGYKIIDWYWYNGKPLTAEGMIFSMERKNGNP